MFLIKGENNMFVVKKYESEDGDDGVWETEISEFKDVLDAIDEMKRQADKAYHKIDKEEAVNYHLMRNVADEALEIMIADDLRQIEIAIEYRDSQKRDHDLPNISNLLMQYALKH